MDLFGWESEGTKRQSHLQGRLFNIDSRAQPKAIALELNTSLKRRFTFWTSINTDHVKKALWDVMDEVHYLGKN